MPSTPTNDHHRLISLIGAARAEAERLGSPVLAVVRLLDEADRTARSLSPPGQEAREGVRVQDLTTANDL